MAERPILFSAPMVRAILAGAKTQTRRAVKPQPRILAGELLCWKDDALTDDQMAVRCRYGQPGDRLWVREAWARTRIAQDATGVGVVVYRESDNRTDYGGPWKPSIHMPRAASRILLEVTAVRVERLQDISATDAIAEGLSTRLREHDAVCHLLDQYRDLWESINGPESWDANPWVWVVEFKRVTP